MTNEKLYSTLEIEAMLGVAEATLSRAVRKGKLPSTKVGRHNGLKLSDVKAWMERDYHPEQAKRYPSRAKVRE